MHHVAGNRCQRKVKGETVTCDHKPDGGCELDYLADGRRAVDRLALALPSSIQGRKSHVDERLEVLVRLLRWTLEDFVTVWRLGCLLERHCCVTNEVAT